MSGFGPKGRDLSIMIPTFNAGELLRDTLSSLDSQTLDISDAQIKILDNCSTKDDPQRLAQQVLPDRVSFHQHQENLGLVSNFNACVDHAERRWVYILHGDDYPMVDGLKELDNLAAQYPLAKALFGRVIIMDEVGVPYTVNGSLGPRISGQLDIEKHRWRACPTQFVGTIVTKSAYQQVGRFDPTFGYATDFLTWWKLASSVPTYYSNRVVGAYRTHSGNTSSTLVRSGQNLEESANVLKEIGKDIYGSVSAAVSAGHFDVLAEWIYTQALEFLVAGDKNGYRTLIGHKALADIGVSRRLKTRERARKAGRLFTKIAKPFGLIYESNVRL